MELYCGVDLHGNNGYYGILDGEGRRVQGKRLPNDLAEVLKLLEPHRESLVEVVVESTFNWYWLVDGLRDHGYRAEDVEGFFDDERLALMARANVETVRFLTERIREMERMALSQVELKPGFVKLLGVPGIGRVLALVIMLETGDIGRFKGAGNFVSYCRCVKARRESNAKSKGQNNRTNGNRYLCWAFIEEAWLFSPMS